MSAAVAPLPSTATRKDHAGLFVCGACGQEQIRSRGTSYCLTCDGPLIDGGMLTVQMFEAAIPWVAPLFVRAPIIVDYPISTALEALAVSWPQCAAEGPRALARCLVALEEVAGRVVPLSWPLSERLKRYRRDWAEVMPATWIVVRCLDEVTALVRVEEGKR